MADNKRTWGDFAGEIYENTRGLFTGDSAVYTSKDGAKHTLRDGDSFSHDRKGAVTAKFNLNSKGKEIEILLGIEQNDDLVVTANGTNIVDDFTIAESRMIAKSIKNALKDGRFTAEEHQGIEAIITKAIDARTFKELRGEGARISPEEPAFSNGVFVTQNRDGTLSNINVETGRGSSVRLSTFLGGSAEVTTGDYRGGNKQERDVSANISKQELAAIQAKFKQYSQDGFLSNAELKDLGQMTTQAANTTAAQDKAKGGR